MNRIPDDDDEIEELRLEDIDDRVRRNRFISDIETPDDEDEQDDDASDFMGLDDDDGLPFVGQIDEE